jgi:hypothetical protein
MERTDAFLISKKPYAVKTMSLDISLHGSVTMQAVWFRRRAGVTVACAGILWDHMPSVRDTADFLDRIGTARYGANCVARWDGERLWTDPSLPYVNPYPDLLRPMLENFPAVPAGYDGWWVFRR